MEFPINNVPNELSVKWAQWRKFNVVKFVCVNEDNTIVLHDLGERSLPVIKINSSQFFIVKPGLITCTIFKAFLRMFKDGKCQNEMALQEFIATKAIKNLPKLEYLKSLKGHL